jgi:hypothetical protein
LREAQEEEIPITNFQIPNKFQIPNLKIPNKKLKLKKQLSIFLPKICALDKDL